MMNRQSVARALQRSCSLAARLTRAQAAAVVMSRRGTTTVIAAFGMPTSVLDAEWKMDLPETDEGPIVMLKGMNWENILRRHPFLRAVPFARSAFLIPVCERRGQSTRILIIDPAVRLGSQLGANLLEVAHLVEDMLEIKESVSGQIGFAEGAAGGEDYATIRFLLETLVNRPRLRTRKDISYVTLRSWRTDIKKWQLAAFKAIKSETADQFADHIALEISDAVRRLMGGVSIDLVVPVPCGHSKSDECLSVLIARKLARKTQAQYVSAFENRPRVGSSHPRKNISLPPLRLLKPVSGSVLLVDDVATSGTHIQSAAAHLKETAKQVVAVAWLG